MALLMVSVTSKAATTVPCGIPIELEDWTVAGSPYLINCDVQVDSLTIGPGVTVLFLSNAALNVTGYLRAQGTASDPISFTSTNSAVGWKNIYFQEVALGSYLRHCIIEQANNSGVWIEDCIVGLEDCIFQSNSSSSGGALYIDNRNPGGGDIAVIRSVFSGNTSGGHGGAVNALMGTHKLTLEQCILAANTANPNTGNASVVGGGVRVDGQSEFINCHFIGNRCNACAPTLNTRTSLGGGVYSDNGNAFFRNCVFTNNYARAIGCPGSTSADPRGRGGAIYAAGGSLTNINCIVAYNDTSGNDGANGAAIYVAAGPAYLLNCTVVENFEIGIRGLASSTILLNSIVYFNNGGGLQISGVTNIMYSNVQGGVPSGPGNKSVSPSLGPLTTTPATCLRILASSQCVDSGDPEPLHNDLCFPPSRGAARNDMGAHGGPGACCWDAPCSCPIVELESKVACAGTPSIWCVTAAGAAPLNYQWRYHGNSPANQPVDISNATGPCLALNNVGENDGGYYSVLVSNAFCSSISDPALLLVNPVCFSLDLYPGLNITGQIGRTYCIEYTEELTINPVWVAATSFTLTAQHYFYRDPQPARHCDSGMTSPPRRFYRIKEGACP